MIGKMILMAVAVASGVATLPAAEFFYGGIRQEGTNTWVTWSNVPPAIIVQGSTDMTNWVDLVSMARIGNTNRFEFFEYRVGVETNSNFMRLRTP